MATPASAGAIHPYLAWVQAQVPKRNQVSARDELRYPPAFTGDREFYEEFARHMDVMRHALDFSGATSVRAVTRSKAWGRPYISSYLEAGYAFARMGGSVDRIFLRGGPQTEGWIDWAIADHQEHGKDHGRVFAHVVEAERAAAAAAICPPYALGRQLGFAVVGRSVWVHLVEREPDMAGAFWILRGAAVVRVHLDMFNRLLELTSSEPERRDELLKWR
ncbi:MAG: hypothetical protein HZA54_02705 [Planctomycetes bacterium]|nr:hypothetical protein [Planctomycetota bacterium]